MYQRMRLWWQDPTDEELEAEQIEEEFQEYMRILHEHKGDCPTCGTPLAIGVGDYTVGRTCDNCHYHDFSFLYPEIELLDWDWKPNLLQRIKSCILKSTRRLTTTVARALSRPIRRG